MVAVECPVPVRRNDWSGSEAVVQRRACFYFAPGTLRFISRSNPQYFVHGPGDYFAKSKVRIAGHEVRWTRYKGGASPEVGNSHAHFLVACLSALSDDCLRNEYSRVPISCREICFRPPVVGQCRHPICQEAIVSDRPHPSRDNWRGRDSGVEIMV